MRIAFERRAIHVGSRITFVRIANHVLLALGLSGSKRPLLARRETRTAAATKTRTRDLVNDLLRLHFEENFFESLVAIASDVVFDLVRINHAAVAEDDSELLLVEVDSIDGHERLALIVVVEQAIHDTSLDEMLLNNRVGVLRLDANIEGIFGEDLDDRSLFAETEATGTDDLNVVLKPSGFDFVLEIFGELNAATGVARRATAHEYIVFKGHCLSSGYFTMSIAGLSQMWSSSK